MSSVLISGSDPLIAMEKRTKALNDFASRLPQRTEHKRTQKQRKVYNSRKRANESLETAKEAIRAADTAWSAVFDLDLTTRGLQDAALY